jgi:hypothetical protein
LDADEKRRGVVEIGYWSRGVFLDVRRRVDALGGLIGKITRMGVEPYLKSEGAADAEGLRSRIAETDTLGDALDDLGDLYKARYAASCERSRWGETLVNFLSDEINLTWLEDESGFRERDRERGADERTLEEASFKDYMKLQYPNEETTQDTREWLELVFVSAALTRIFVYIVPEERGKEVRNRVMLYVDYGGSETAEFAREIRNHVLESLRVSEDEGVVVLVSDLSRLTSSPDAALRRTGLSLENKLKRR